MTSESENSDGDHPPALCWRTDPEKSFSDWTIIVGHGDTEWVYHVHKCVLACGGLNASHYFAQLFHSENFVETEKQRSTILFDHEEEAAVFPYLLDALYHSEKPIPFNAQNVLTLRHLGDYFGFPRLKQEAVEAWRRFLPEHVVDIYRQGERYNYENVLQAVGSSLYRAKKWRGLLGQGFRAQAVWQGVHHAISHDSSFADVQRDSSRWELKMSICVNWSREVASLWQDGEIAVPLEKDAFYCFLEEKAMSHIAEDAVLNLLLLHASFQDESTECDDAFKSFLQRLSRAMKRKKISEEERNKWKMLPSSVLLQVLWSAVRSY